MVNTRQLKFDPTFLLYFDVFIDCECIQKELYLARMRQDINVEEEYLRNMKQVR
jgi:hypothetical protein